MTTPPRDGASRSSGPERVLAEALQVMAGGERSYSDPPVEASAGDQPRASLQLIHLILLAAIVGVLVGIVAALILT